jgi:hypothetical protein
VCVYRRIEVGKMSTRTSWKEFVFTNLRKFFLGFMGKQ